MPIRIVVFDAYGTLFDVTSAARAAAGEQGREVLADLWPRLSELWRQKQLQYTWLRAITGDHADFEAVTEDGLDWTMEALGVDDPDLRNRLLELYRTLDAYPEVPDMLHAVRSQGLVTAILSNGTPAMLASAVASAGIGNMLDAVLSVEEVGVFKPARAVYDLVGTHFGTSPDEVLFVSSNGWDAAGAARYGFRAVWVNRAGDPVDRLMANPAVIRSDLTSIPAIARGD